MPRENSFSDSDGRSLTPDLEDEDDRERQEEMDLPAPSPLAARPPQLLVNDFSTPPVASTHAHGAAALSPRSPSIASARSPRSPRAARNPSVRANATPKDRFKASVRKVIAMHRTSTMMSRGNVGAEPGIDVRRSSAYMTYGHIRQKCMIDIVDYSPLRASSGRMTNTEFVRYLQDPKASEREPWVRVRWINVGGISWDIISALALKYDLHPLALEDLLHQRGHSRSKSDYYPQHLFIRTLCHTLASAPTQYDFGSHYARGGTPSSTMSGKTFTNLPRSASPVQMDEKIGIADESEENLEGYGDGDGLALEPELESPPPRRGLFGRRQTTADSEHGGKPSSILAKKRKQAATAITLDQLKKGERVNVHIAPMCIFLFRDGTVISIHPDANLDLTAPIAGRVRQRDTSLRKTADASLLVESLLDLIVDSALEIVDEYHTRINKLERQILIKPKVKTVRDLHILSGDLILHKRTLGPIKTLVYGLRRYDVDRCAALIDSTKPIEDQKVVGFMSHKSKIYLADVHDHMEYVLTSLDMYADMSENLINYTFNMASYEMNEVMRRLTLVTIVCLPLTLLTGYFGMNFNVMWSVQQHSDVLFWIIALPVMAIVIPMFVYPDFQRMVHYISKRMVAQKVKKEYKHE
ncbi:hypothetical protein DENSPDRAFT_884939 [Dentipellis sp. KUC8613]|nr:hypothetical protein DENSPDRAFT_884939 [Dentipellis sp. KUC8613]